MTDTTTTDTTDTEPARTGPLGIDSAPITLSDHARAVADDLRATAVPPNFWTTGRPPLKEAWEFVTRGPHLPDDDRAHVLARVGVGITLLIRAPLYALDWALENPSRALFTLVLTFCLLKLLNLI